ncbi:PAS domain S-box protein [Gillisia sp. M10.2A]|uniref:histidine kinase n=1 Tax=Gillisia lutea TaxID=2909668 RepID=A0ABS9EKQ9_9FLAO|nr:PAS domain S-box protein [Gillisia lutea]MCF4102744.1 PAS domain S-box protein [Gillisia lutea]
MPQLNSYLQSEFYELLKNDPSVFKWLSGNVVDGIWYCDLENKENVWISENFWDTLGYSISQDKNVESNWNEIMLASDRPYVLSLVTEAAMNPDKPFETVFKSKHTDNKMVLLGGKGYITSKENGVKSRLLLVFHNVNRDDSENLQLLSENKYLKKLNEVFNEANELTRIGGWEMDLVNHKLTWTKVTKDIHEVDQDYEPDLNTGINFYKKGESRDRIAELFKAAVEDGIPFNEELQIVTIKGNEVWVRAFGKPEMKNGRCVRVYGAFQDINLKKNRELELKLSQDRFQQIFHNSSIGIVLVNPDNTLVMINPATLNIFGYENATREETLGLTFRDVTHPDDLATAHDYRTRLLSGEINNYKLQGRFIKRNGEIIWCNINTSLIKNDDGSPSLIITQVEDITFRKELEAKAQESANQFRSAFEFSPNGMAMVGLKGDWLSVNRTLSQMAGYPHKEFLKISFHGHTHPGDRTIDEELVTELLSNKREAYTIEKRYLHKDGSIIYGLLNVSLLRDEESNPLYFITQINDITESRLAKEALRDSLHELQSVMDATTQVSLIEADLSGTIRKINRGAENLLGYTSEELIGKENVILFHDEEEVEKRGRELSEKYGRQIGGFDVFIQKAKDGKFESREWTYVRKDGSRFSIQLVVTAVTNDQGEIISYIGVASDISYLKNIEMELRESQQRWKFALEGSGDGVWDWDIQEGKQYLSNHAKNMLGFDSDEALTDIKDWDDRIHPNDKEKSNRAVKDYFDNKVPLYNVEKRVRCKDGSYKWILDRGKIIEWDEDGNPVRMIGTQSDITERKNAEQLIKENELRFRSLYELSPIGIGLIDIESGKFINANIALLESVGYDYDEILDITYRECIPQGEDQDIEKLEHFLQFGTDDPFEHEFIRKDGRSVPVLVNGVRMKDASGKKIILSTIEDITSRKEMENSLVKAKIKAESANKSKSEFLANMSHEIRTPLNGVIGFTDLLMKTELNPSQKQYMKTVYNSANSLLDLINDILDFSKIEAGKLELSEERTDLIELCGQTVDIIKHQAHEKNLEILLNISPDVNRYIFADPVRIRQILTNLLGNAVKFTEKGEVELKIEAKLLNVDSSEMQFTFTIRDTGIGIAPNNLAKIFNAFDQEDSSTTRKYGGTGLGLTISNKLLELMDSKLKVESTLGIGSEFSFNVTLETEKGHSNFKESSKEIQKVLVVDDNENNRIILQEMLAISNIETHLVANGIEALQTLEVENDFDLAIVDYNMPYMNGIELISHIRQKLLVTSDILPIILLHSSADDDKIHQACKDLEVQFNVTKPIQIDQLFRMLKNIKVPLEDSNNYIKESASSETSEIYTILVAEDNPVNKFLAKTIILKALPNANILEANDGLEAVETYKTKQVDLIFMDIQMPQMSGFEATTEIRAYENKAMHVPIIALTARTVKGEEERCASYGMDGYITKPVIFDTINDIIKLYLIEKDEPPKALETPEKATDLKLHYDRNELFSKFMGNEEDVAELMKIVTSNLNKLSASLADEIAKENLDNIKKVAHSIKGTALNCNFNILRDLAIELESIQSFKKDVLSQYEQKINDEIKFLINII